MEELKVGDKVRVPGIHKPVYIRGFAQDGRIYIGVTMKRDAELILVKPKDVRTT